jgi:L-fuculose-phosphate aldolase
VDESSNAQLRLDIIDIGCRLYNLGLIVAAQGNISVRTPAGLLVTASGVSKGALTPSLVLDTDFEGRRTGAGVSSEIQMHVAIYKRRPDVRAIIHAHPPAVTAFAVAGLVPDSAVLAESIQLLGCVPLVPYAPPSTPALAELVGSAMIDAHAALLANHGAVSLGETLELAMGRMETLEHLARVTLLARALGEPRRLDPAEVERLLSLGRGHTQGQYR